jgi:MYXO-CTERM domain-containing protein
VYQEVKAPLAQAYCTIQVDGVGGVDTEQDYLPHVIQCENGGANLQALKAQAISARSVAYYNMATSGSICNSQSCQVYSCGKTPTAIHHQAVDETSGMYLSYDAMLTYGFYVAGDSNTSPPGCVGSTGTTEKWVTYNEGKTGADVEQTALGYVSYPIFGQNRGCMGQWGARCLENNKGYDYLGILRFYYGADIQVLTAPGSCVIPVLPELDATWTGSGSDAETTGQGSYRVCAGTGFHFWFEVENTGSASWSDGGGANAGSAIRLGVPGDGTDPLTGMSRISLNENANNDVRSSGGDCSDAPQCRRTRFVAGSGIAATAPSVPGTVVTTWQLVDEGRAWFGAPTSLTFEVVECEGGSGGTGGDSGDAGSGDAGAGGGTDAGWDAGGMGGSAGSVPSVYSAQEPEGCACAMVGGKDRRGEWFALLVGLVWLRKRKS